MSCSLWRSWSGSSSAGRQLLSACLLLFAATWLWRSKQAELNEAPAGEVRENWLWLPLLWAVAGTCGSSIAVMLAGALLWRRLPMGRVLGSCAALSLLAAVLRLAHPLYLLVVVKDATLRWGGSSIWQGWPFYVPAFIGCLFFAGLGVWLAQRISERRLALCFNLYLCLNAAASLAFAGQMMLH